MTPNPDQIQQGDVTLERVASLPEGCKPLPRSAGRVVLAEGSQSGNSHYLDAAGVTHHEAPDGKRYLVNEGAEAVELKHTRDHDPILVAPGVHLVGDLNEADHVAGMVRKVVD